MARFVFQLDGVLRHRERLEKDRQRELAVVNAEMDRLESQLRALKDDVQQSSADVRDNHLTGRLDMNYLAAHRRYMLGVQKQAMDLAQKIGQQQKRVDEARRAMAEASMQKKILEKLRERHQHQWAAQLALGEANALDEMTTQLSHRNLSGAAEEAT
jgi:flagellar protein FliJ